MALTTKIALSVIASLTSVGDLSTGADPLSYLKDYSWPSGTAAGQADRLFSDERTLAASATEDLDVAGVLLDRFGAAITFARIRAMIFHGLATNTNNVIVGGASATQFVSWCGGAAHTITVRPGGTVAFIAPDTTAYAVTATTADLLKVANSAGGTEVKYQIILIGASA